METVTYTGDDDDIIIVVEEQKEGDHLAEVQREARKRADSILGKMTSSMTYKLADRPPWYSTIVLAFQVRTSVI